VHCDCGHERIVADWDSNLSIILLHMDAEIVAIETKLGAHFNRVLLAPVTEPWSASATTQQSAPRIGLAGEMLPRGVQADES